MNKIFETKTFFLVIGIVVLSVISIFTQIVPLFVSDSVIEDVQGMRPYTPLEYMGKRIYIREGCSLCHSQQIRALRAEVERYGPYSLAAESKYDHPFLWGSKRTGPDLARVGGKYSNEWQKEHLLHPRQIVSDSIMPGYPFLMDELDTSDLKDYLKTEIVVGTPYTAEQMDKGNKEPVGNINMFFFTFYYGTNKDNCIHNPNNGQE